RKKQHSRSLVAVLALKGIGSLLGLAFAIMAYAALSNAKTATPHFGTQVQDAHALANLALVMILVSAVELAGVLGTYAFKRWGVFIVVGFTVFAALLHVKNGETYSAAFGLMSTALLAFLIFPRWVEYE
ncbi:MAG TPA: hypothetical protein VF316_12325, partial [Polyangiaceae bacterium]